MTSANQQERINTELKAVGVKSFGRWIHSTRSLAAIIGQDEHIEAAVYGLSAEGTGMLVATNRRVVYVESNVTYHSSDEFPYDAITGVKHQASVLYGSLILHTRIHEYNLTLVNHECAERFARVVEQHAFAPPKEESSVATSTAPVANQYQVPIMQPVALVGGAREFLQSHRTLVLSTASRTGQVHSAVLFYVYHDAELYILTKKETQKARNMMRDHAATAVVYDESTLTIVTIQGVVQAEADPQVREAVFARMKQMVEGGLAALPIARLDAGAYVVFRIQPVDVVYHNYSARAQ